MTIAMLGAARRGAASVLACLVLTALPSGVAAAPTRVRLELRPCDTSPIELEALRRRIALELAVSVEEIVLEGEAAVAVRVEPSCDSTEVEVSIRLGGGPERSLHVDLGGSVGEGRVWTLALLISEQVRDLRVELIEDVQVEVSSLAASTAPTASSSRGAERPPHAAGVLAVPIEHDALQEPVHTLLSIGLAARATFDVVTIVSGLELAIDHDWLRVAIVGQGTDVPSNTLGSIETALFTLEIGARPVTYRDGAFALAPELALSGGLTYARGRPSRTSVVAADAFSGVLGASIGVRLRWRPEPGPGFDVAAALGYDLLGPDLRAGADVTARLNGLRASLSIALLFAP
jgi:hypothetical protein